MKFRELKTITERRKYLENLLKLDLEVLSVYPKGLEIAQNKNCENMIGAVSLPLGITGPLKVNGKYANGSYYLPLATTEGALVASINRGCKAITESGGATVFCHDVGISRGSVFMTNGLKESLRLKLWLEKNLTDLKEITLNTSSHLQLLKIKIKVIGVYLFVRFSFDSQEAMGMNMATFAADKIANFILEKTGIRCLSLAGNFDNDKKPSYLNFLEGRGRTVQAEVIISKDIVKKVLKTTPEAISKVVKAKCYLGSMLSGSLGYNAHYANILSAVYIALGQDPAHAAEGCVGITSTEITKSDLYFSVYLPDLPLGTVGGGTSLPSQKVALKILGVSGGKKGEKARMLAEIIGCGVLAGELSLLAALAGGELANAHRKLTKG